MRYLKVFLKYRNLLYELIKRDIKVKYRRSVLGLFWSLLSPLLSMTVLSIVFSQLFKFEIPNYAVYVLTGIVFFTFFSESTSTAMMTIIYNAPLIKKVYIPKYVLVAAKTISSFVSLNVSLIAVIIILLAYTIEINWSLLLFPLPLIYIFVFAMGVSLILSTCVVFFRDLIHLYSVVLTAWMYLTPIIYPVEIIQGHRFAFLVELNPLYHLLQCFREIMLYARVPSLELNMICIGISFTTLLVGLYVFYKNQDKFILYV